MKKLVVLKAIMLCLLFSQSIMLQAQSKNLSFVPQIKYEKATLSGKIIRKSPSDRGFKSIVLSFSNLVTSDRTNCEIPVKNDGTFTVSIPIQCISIGVASSDFYNGIICLIPGEESKMEITFDSNQKKHVELINSLGITADDAMNIMEVITLALNTKTGNVEEIVTPELFSRQIMKTFQDKLKIIEASSKLSDAAKQIASSEVRTWYISEVMLNYVEWMHQTYINQNKNDTGLKEFKAQIPEKSYYSFLKYFNFNDPSYLSASLYSRIFQSLLNNEIMAIPAIGEISVDAWLIKAKEILKDDISSDTGIFYDLLVSNAYANQLNEMNPLSDIQKKNIRSYFVNKSFTDILIDENEKVIQLAAQSSKERIFKNDRSSDKVMDSIISKYKGKIVFVDFWATWCGPCIAAMQISESVKREFENKDVVFVYITYPSSPRKAWEQKISGIRGEHYYVTEKEWDNLNKTYSFTGIPHYLIFDKSGIIKHNYHTFMGNKNMKKWIGELL